MDLDEFGGESRDKPLQLVGQAAEFQFESKFKPQLVIGHYFLRLLQQYGDFDCKIIVQGLGVSWLLSCTALVGQIGKCK